MSDTTTAEPLTAEQREQFITDMKKRMERLEQEFEQLNRSVTSAEVRARTKFESMRSDFQEKRDHLQTRIQSGREAGAAAWSELRTGIEAAWNDMSDAFNRARAELVDAS